MPTIEARGPLRTTLSVYAGLRSVFRPQFGVTGEFGGAPKGRHESLPPGRNPLSAVPLTAHDVFGGGSSDNNGHR